MLPKNVPAKSVGQNVCTEMLAEKRPEQLSPNWQYWNAAQKITRKNSRVKCPNQNASWRSVHRSYH